MMGRNRILAGIAVSLLVCGAAGAAELWHGVDARVDVVLDTRALEAMDLDVATSDQVGVSPIHFDQAGNVDLAFFVTDGAVDAAGVSGGLALEGGLRFTVGGVEIPAEGLRLERDSVGLADRFVVEADSFGGRAIMVLDAARVGFDRSAEVFQLHSERVRLADGFARALGVDPEFATQPVGAMTIEADSTWLQGDPPESGIAGAGDPLSGEIGPDVTFCQLFGLSQFGASDGIVGLALATTSWNVGDRDLLWHRSPEPEHPFIVMNLYRLMDNQFEQIGQSWIKHGFFALSSTQCGGRCTHENGHGGGRWLGVGCTDTYGASLNASQSGLGPRYEVNPWTGGWQFQGSVFDLGGPRNTPIARRLQVHDDDLDPAMNEGAEYFAEGYYADLDDVNVMNSVSWKPVTPRGSRRNWSFTMSGPGTRPNIGPAIDAWKTAQQTMLAQEIPVVEFVSPDGRSVLAAEVTDLGGGRWHYEYALLNIDMDRQVGSFSIPVPSGADITNVGFHAVEHHNEPFNLPTWRENEGRVPIDNNPWDAVVTPSSITWATDSNPLRWGTLYNFRFDADVAPASTPATLGMFRPGTPGEVRGITTGPLLELTHHNPESLVITRGVLVEGDRLRLIDSDDSYVVVSAVRSDKLAAASVEIEVGGTVPTTDPFELRFIVEAATTGDPTAQQVHFFNYDSGTWELVDTRDGTGEDRMITVTVSDNPARFVNADGQVRARVGFLDLDVTFVNWVGRYDTAYWSVVE